MLDPVVGESFSWIRVNAVFSNHSMKGRETWCDMKIEVLTSWRSENYPTSSFKSQIQLPFDTPFCFYLSCISSWSGLMRPLGTGYICSLGSVVRNILKLKGAVTVYQSRGCMSVCNGSWGSGLACVDQSVCTISHWGDKWWSLFLDLMQSSTMYFVMSSFR